MDKSMLGQAERSRRSAEASPPAVAALSSPMG